MATSSTLSISNARSTRSLSLPVVVSLFLSALTTPSVSLSLALATTTCDALSQHALSRNALALALFRPRSLGRNEFPTSPLWNRWGLSRIRNLATHGLAFQFTIFSSQYSLKSSSQSSPASPALCLCLCVRVCFQFLQRNNKQKDLQKDHRIISSY